MYKSIVFPLTVAAALVASLAGPVLSIQTAVATTTDRLFSASIAPTAALTSQSQSYVVTIANSNSSDRDIRSASVAIPSGWSVNSATLALGGVATSGSDRWDSPVYSGGLVKANKHSNSGGVANGHSFTISFTATAPGSAGTGTFTTRSFEDNNYWGGEFSQTNSEPKVTVTHAPETLADICSDGIDNDHDGLTDSQDPDCAAFYPHETTQALCSDGIDNDVDGTTDLADSDCAAYVPPPVVDVCPNLDDVQATVPEGYQLVGDQCELIPPPVVDVCPNLDDVQATVPEGYQLVGDQCELIPPPPVDPTGSITVCKVIADAQGNAVTASSETTVPYGSFTVSGFTPSQTSEATPVGAIGLAGFVTPLTWNANLLGDDSVLDAQCVGFSGLTLGGYYYDQEQVSPSTSIWLAPKYNDQNSVNFSSIADAFAYDANLFDGNADNDGDRNQNADGHIVLSAERPNRTLVVVNQFTNEEQGGGDGVENTEVLCTDGFDNDSDNAIDAADSDCAEFQGGDGEGDGVENTEALCTDGLDNNDNQLIDAADPDCAPFQNGDGEQGDDEDNGSEDQTPPQSGGGQYLEEGTYRCTNGYDDDGNGLTDAADPKCATNGGQGVTTSTGNGVPQGEVLGASICGPLLKDYMRQGKKNDPEEVKKLQQFLNDHMKAGLEVTGSFGPLTTTAVENFQVKYWDEVLSPWKAYGHSNDHQPTGYVYKTTLRKINNLFCDALNLPIPQLP